MEDCVFCNIAQKNIKSDIIYENDTVFAFKDINPKAKVHVLVIPKIHIEGLRNLKDEHHLVVFALMKAINKVAEITGIFDSGFRVIANTGKDSGQEVYHMHFHVLGGQYLPFEL